MVELLMYPNPDYGKCTSTAQRLVHHVLCLLSGA
jgi:hypothetical protein